MVDVSIDKALGSVEGVNPDNHVLLVEFSMELFSCSLAGPTVVNTIHFIDIVPITPLVVSKALLQHVLGYLILVNLIWVDEGLTGIHVAQLIFFPYYSRSWEYLLEVELDSVLDVQVGHGDYVGALGPLLNSLEALGPPGLLDDLLGFF